MVDRLPVPPCARTRRIQRVFVWLAAAVAFLIALGAPASAHNTLLSSSPMNGAEVAVVERVSFSFSKDVPIDTVSVELIGPDGVRQQLTGLRHGPSGSMEVVADLPDLDPGAVRLRWRLVGPDGHAITGRVAFTLSDGTTGASSTPRETLQPAREADVPATASSGILWALRFLGYLDMMIVVGVFASTLLVWPRTWDLPPARMAVAVALGSGSALALAQIAVIGGDIAGEQPWTSTALAKTGAALQTDAAKALLLRVVLLAAVAGAAFAWRSAPVRLRLGAPTALTMAALGTWAFAGHARTMRMPLLGVPVDIVHHGAAAVWLGGLAVLGIGARRLADPAELVTAAKRFARVAAWAVGLLVATGVVQTIRLTDSPREFFTGTHGQLLIGKLFVLAAMLKVADINRLRVTRRLASIDRRSLGVVRALGRAITTEMAVGIAILGITAALVVSPPAVADDAPQPPANAELPDSGALTTTTTASAIGGVRGPDCAEAVPVLREGATGPAVACLQRALAENGYPEVEATGQFDAATVEAVKALQTREGLGSDGVVGRRTAEALGLAFASTATTTTYSSSTSQTPE